MKSMRWLARGLVVVALPAGAAVLAFGGGTAHADSAKAKCQGGACAVPVAAKRGAPRPVGGPGTTTQGVVTIFGSSNQNSRGMAASTVVGTAQMGYGPNSALNYTVGAPGSTGAGESVCPIGSKASIMANQIISGVQASGQGQFTPTFPGGGAFQAYEYDGQC